MVAVECIPDALCHEPGVSFPDQRLLGAWLYGSRADGRDPADSDVDIAVLCDAPLDPVALFDAAGRLATRLGAAVDLVDLRRAGGLLRVEATHRGRALVPPATEADFFTTHALADHAACREDARRSLGVPVDSADAFTLLERDRVLSPAVAERMRRMVGFRNIAVHECRRLDPAVVRTVVTHRLGDFEALCRELADGD